MVEQAGIYRIVLYENKDVNLVFRPDGSIEGISNAGDILTLENSDEDTRELDLILNPRKNKNNKLRYKHTIIWKQLGLDSSNFEIINTLKNSIYGWLAKIEFYNNTEKIITNPFRFNESSINNNISNHYEIALNNINFGNRMNSFIESLGYLFEDDIEVLFEDDNIYIFD